ncbi:MAG: flagellar hook-length control protein FliK [Lachnospiraceae bacterium]|nr:flagellar hook-length control protein FliK [Lachnospiraceae bacterium]
MQVRDLVSQYYNNLSAGSDVSTKTKGVEQLTSTVNSLQKGQIFEGTIVGVKGSQVTLGLSNGQTISARLDKGVSLTQGQSVFFEVKSSDAETIQIRPVSIGGTMNNPTLMNALSSAGLPMTEPNLNLVNSMMQQQLPIDANSLNQMAHLLAAHPGAEPKTLVSLTKNGLPVTDDMITQYNNYKAGEGEILSSVENMTEDISSFFSSDAVSEEGAASFMQNLSDVLEGTASLQEYTNVNPADIPESPMVGPNSTETQAPAFPKEGTTIIISMADEPVSAGENIILADGEGTSADPAASANGNAASANGKAVSEDGEAVSEYGGAVSANEEAAAVGNAGSGAAGVEGTGEAAPAILPRAEASTETSADSVVSSESSPQQAADRPLSAPPLAEDVLSQSTPDAGTGETVSGLTSNSAPVIPTEEQAEEAGRGSLAKTVDAGGLSDLNNIMKNLGGKENPAFSKLLDENGNLKYDVPAKDVFSALVKTAAKGGHTKALLRESAFSDLMKGVMGNEWSLSPEEVKDPQKVKDLYAKTASDMSMISKAAADAAGSAGNPVSQTGNALESNIDFVNTLNQALTYVQLPVKLSNGNTNADLYVYTNKKRNPADGDEVSAFLHFDMDYLGSTDISVRMKGKSVDTKFFMEDDDSYRLIQNNIHILADRLEALGYAPKISVEPGEKPVNLIEDILEKDAGTAGSLQRYSFDMRA